MVNTTKAELAAQNTQLAEELSQVRTMMALDDLGWKRITGGEIEVSGPSLSHLKEIAERSREMAVGSAIIKRGLTLRFSYVWSKTLRIPGVKDEPTVDDDKGKRKPGRKTALERFVTNRINKRTIFSDEAHQQMEFSVATDGCFLALGDEATKTVRQIPLSEIKSIYVNPDFSSEIWAYLRHWTSVDTQGERITREEWVYTDSFVGPLPKKIKDVGVNQSQRIIDLWVNRQVGWALGTPDVLPALQWARTYTELVHYGKMVNDALASFVAKVKVKSKSASDAVGLKVAAPGAANVTTYGEGNEVDVFSSAGRTYDFNGIRPVAALVATALEVSIVHLLSDPGAAGSSYGSASNLDLPTKRAMTARQNLWADYLERVLLWGTGEDVKIEFPPLEEPDQYREMQSVMLGWNSGLVHGDEARPRLLQVAGITPKHQKAPAGVMLPNNEKSLQRKDIDTDASGPNPTTGSPDQGQSNNVSSTDSTLNNDIVNDPRSAN